MLNHELRLIRREVGHGNALHAKRDASPARGDTQETHSAAGHGEQGAGAKIVAGAKATVSGACTARALTTARCSWCKRSYRRPDTHIAGPVPTTATGEVSQRAAIIALQMQSGPKRGKNAAGRRDCRHRPPRTTLVAKHGTSKEAKM